MSEQLPYELQPWREDPSDPDVDPKTNDGTKTDPGRSGKVEPKPES